MINRRAVLVGGGAAATLLIASGRTARAQAIEGPELYQGERALYEAASREGLAISSNTSPGWANFAALFRAFGQRYPAITLVYNNIGSAAAVQSMDRARNRPTVDTVYLFGPSAVDAASRGLLAPFKPVNFDRLPAQFRDVDGLWCAPHQMPITFIVNRRLVKNVPKSWADLRKPEYKGQIIYSDPRTTTVGQTSIFAANAMAGGTLASVQPGVDYFAELHQAGQILRVDADTPYAAFLRGQAPIWIGFENDGLRAILFDGMGDQAEVVLPTDGTVSVPYAVSLVKGARNENAGKLWLNYMMSEAGQRLFAEGMVRPAITGLSLPPDQSARMPPPPKIEPLDMTRALFRKPDVDRGWARAVLNQ